MGPWLGEGGLWTRGDTARCPPGVWEAKWDTTCISAGLRFPGVAGDEVSTEGAAVVGRGVEKEWDTVGRLGLSKGREFSGEGAQ